MLQVTQLGDNERPAQAGARTTSEHDRVEDRPLVWQAAVLFGSCREAIIEFEGQQYRLRLTSNNKLILTK